MLPSGTNDRETAGKRYSEQGPHVWTRREQELSDVEFLAIGREEQIQRDDQHENPDNESDVVSFRGGIHNADKPLCNEYHQGSSS